MSGTVQHGAASRQGSPAALVAALFGTSGRPTLPGAALVALLGDLGLAPPAARRALARMREQGQLVTTRRGRQVDHHLTGAFRASVERLRDDRGEPPPWEGFHTLLHQVPESARSYRDRLRRTAVLVGYAPWQPGVLISAVDRSGALVEVLAEAPPGASVVLGRLTVDGGFPDDGFSDHDRRDDELLESGRPGPPHSGDHGVVGRTDAVAAAMARRAWALDDLAADLRAHLPVLHAALDAPPPEAGPDALRRLVTITNAVFVDLLRDPGLPRELRPPDWPGDELRVLIGRIVVTHGPAALSHIEQRCEAAG
ncbi:MAG: phenylacetic acid degradation operon negative regulatory protein [Actinomycetota bacterium]|nr:phenylacetic acid degradation operon negative regulatory protein [Actinomycetota bacterium]